MTFVDASLPKLGPISVLIPASCPCQTGKPTLACSDPNRKSVCVYDLRAFRMRSYRTPSARVPQTSELTLFTFPALLFLAHHDISILDSCVGPCRSSGMQIAESP
jgi:hypothetical protein